LQEVIDEGVRRAYLHPENKLRASILADPAFTRVNTRDNTPCVCHLEMVPGDKVSGRRRGQGRRRKTRPSSR
jgi:fumarate hydratase class I